MRYPLILLDLDGTLVDSYESIRQSLLQTLGKLGITLDDGNLRGLMGLPLEEFFRKAGVIEIPRAIDAYRIAYFGSMDALEKPYPGVLQVVPQIARFSNLALVTNKGPVGTGKALARLGFDKLFGAVVCDDGKTAKPSPAVLDKVLKEFLSRGIRYEKTDILMVGDSPVDQAFATRCGIDFAFASWGFFRVEDLPVRPGIVLSSIEDLIGVIGADETLSVEITHELDLHAYRPAETRLVLDEYLEAAYHKGFSEVRIVHGKGKGVQKNICESLLAKHPRVLGFRTSPGFLGGTGAILVQIRLDSAF